LTVEESRAAASKVKKEHFHAAKTTALYGSHVQRGKAFLADLAKHNGLPSWPPDYHLAFEQPNEASPIALLQFVVNYMNNGDLKYATAEGIRSAFKDHFQNLGCQGDYWREDGRGGYVGNPVHESEFSNYMTSLRKQDGRLGGRNQSLAISYKDMTALMTYLQKEQTIEENTLPVCLMFEAFAATAFTIWTR